ncbi:lipoprotein [Spiroplasma monobiae]|uniref:lipoprotein n=1 Tax=Spiroplasma monobiae (strain ATCC 33825 / MQ-1) TaxID=2136 RepID=UPI000C7E6F2C|nr:lipoprotein [Spiroplasma monobiae]
MRKLLSVISATALVGTAAMNVVSCSSNAYYKEFKGWIDNKESFLLYIGADDCDHCKNFESTIESEKDYFNDKIDQLNANYETIAVTKHGKSDENSLTNYGQYLNNKVDYRYFKTAEKENNFNEKWSKNILDWMIEEVTEIIKQEILRVTPDFSEKIAYNLAKNSTKTYFNNNKGTPMFLLVRNGKLVGWQAGFVEDTQKWDKIAIDKWFEPLNKIFMEENQEAEIVKLIRNGQTEKEEEPEIVDPEIVDPEIEEVLNYSLKNQEILLSYLLNK